MQSLSMNRLFLFLIYFTFELHASGARSIGSNENRYSFSLTTFSPSGKLQQVEYASLAATTLGTPMIVAVRNSTNIATGPKILFCAQHSVLNPLMNDDGTRRFCNICPGIAVTHCGLSADGRAVITAAQRLAVEHEYTFDEDIPIEIFLEEVSLLFQKYTMKPGARPFGCSLLIMDCTTNSDSDSQEPTIYKIGPSGAVERLGPVAVLGSNLNEGDVMEFLQQEGFWDKDEQEATALLVESLTRSIEKNAAKKGMGISSKQKKTPLSFITASLGRHKNLTTKFEQTKKERNEFRNK